MTRKTIEVEAELPPELEGLTDEQLCELVRRALEADPGVAKFGRVESVSVVREGRKEE